MHFDRGVKHLGLQCCAISPGDSYSVTASLEDLWSCAMVLERRQILGAHLRVAHDGSIGRDKCHARCDQASQCIRFRIEFRGRRCLAMRQRFRREPRLVDETAFDAAVHDALHRPRHKGSTHEQRHSGCEQRSNEQAGSEVHFNLTASTGATGARGALYRTESTPKAPKAFEAPKAPKAPQNRDYTNLYPNCLTVSIASFSTGSFSRS